MDEQGIVRWMCFFFQSGYVSIERKVFAKETEKSFIGFGGKRYSKNADNTIYYKTFDEVKLGCAMILNGRISGLLEDIQRHVREIDKIGDLEESKPQRWDRA